MAISRRTAILAAGAAFGASEWTSLFDGRTLTGWKEAPYTRRGRVLVRDGMLVLSEGRTTGVALARKFPTRNYELRFEAARLAGRDFFAGVTFPVHDSFCFWVNGGWGGSVVGLSNLEGNDASENDTSTTRDFVQGRWYAFRLAVTARRIEARIDDAVVIDLDYTGRKVDLQFDETDLGKPLGFSAYGGTVAGLRKIEYRVTV
ncbi:MAG: DUF1080 domain-containing protein [Bryobacteraceae bacterium]|nr:DUF1080 domain-containing protein [Bryobacteraceae bacterium]